MLLILDLINHRSSSCSPGCETSVVEEGGNTQQAFQFRQHDVDTIFELFFCLFWCAGMWLYPHDEYRLFTVMTSLLMHFTMIGINTMGQQLVDQD